MDLINFSRKLCSQIMRKLFTSKLIKFNSAHIFETNLIISQLLQVLRMQKIHKFHRNCYFILTSFATLKNAVSSNSILLRLNVKPSSSYVEFCINPSHKADNYGFISHIRAPCMTMDNESKLCSSGSLCAVLVAQQLRQCTQLPYERLIRCMSLELFGHK